MKETEELFNVIPRAFRIAEKGRKGPVVIDVPKDVQTKEITIQRWPDVEDIETAQEQCPDAGKIEEIACMINKSRRPLIYAGGGIISSDAADVLYELVHRNSIPIVVTLMGIGVFPPDDLLYAGMLGMHGAKFTNYAVEETDLLLAFGARFDDRAIGKANEFCPRASIVHIDIDDSEIGKIKKTHISMAADIKSVLEALIRCVEQNKRPEWLARVCALKAQHPLIPFESGDYYYPLHLIRFISEIAGPDAIVTTDVGQHQMWVAQAYPFSVPRTLLTSGGLGTMGFGLPAAIGAALANPDRRVICISGDGSFQMNIQELATLAELNLNVTVIIMNNRRLGLVRQQQELFFGGNFIASRFEKRLNFAAISRVFGVRGIDLDGVSDPRPAIRSAFSGSGPCVIDVPIHFAENVFPMVPPGAANREMIDRKSSTLERSRSIDNVRQGIGPAAEANP